MEPLELVEWKEEINDSDGIVEIDGNYKANRIDRIKKVELTELTVIIK